MKSYLFFCRHAKQYLPVEQLHSRAKSLVAKFKQGGGSGYINEAIVLNREALELCPPGLIWLANHLNDRYGQLGATGDLEGAIVLDGEALDHIPQGHPLRAISLNNLGVRLSTRYNQLGAMENLDAAIVLGREALNITFRKRAPAHAVELLEQGQLFGVSLLDSIPRWMMSWFLARQEWRWKTSSSGWPYTFAMPLIHLVQISTNGCRLNLELQRVVTNIRTLPGRSRFLLSSLFPDLQRAASGGPVIILSASRYSCDALIILLDRDPVHIPLHIIQEGVRDLSTELRTLSVRATKADVTKELAFFYANFGIRSFPPLSIASRRRIHFNNASGGVQPQSSLCSPSTLLVRIGIAKRISLISTSRPTPQP